MNRKQKEVLVVAAMAFATLIVSYRQLQIIAAQMTYEFIRDNYPDFVGPVRPGEIP